MDAAEMLVQAILTGGYKPGARLTERAIIDVAGGTHANARVTLHHLEKLGAIRILRHRGAVIVGLEDGTPAEIELVWQTFCKLLEQLSGEPLNLPAVRGDTYADFTAKRARIRDLAGRINDGRLGDLLQRIALHRAILSHSGQG